MFSDSYAFTGFSVDDIPTARAFYADVLGLAVSEANGMLTLLLAGGGRVLVYPKADHQPASFTILNLPVDDIDAAVDALTAAGVTFERYEGLPQDERGIMRSPDPSYGPPVAWFRDPAGNILAVLQVGTHPEAGSTETAAQAAPETGDAGGKVSLQLSVYALRQPHLRPAIEAALGAAAAEDVEITVGRLSTFIRGDEPAVFAALRAAYRAAGSSGSAVLVATLANGAPADATLATIQDGLAGKDA